VLFRTDQSYTRSAKTRHPHSFDENQQVVHRRENEFVGVLGVSIPLMPSLNMPLLEVGLEASLECLDDKGYDAIDSVFDDGELMSLLLSVLEAASAVMNAFFEVGLSMLCDVYFTPR
jgi:hypothetical protein